MNFFLCIFSRKPLNLSLSFFFFFFFFLVPPKFNPQISVLITPKTNVSDQFPNSWPRILFWADFLFNSLRSQFNLWARVFSLNCCIVLFYMFTEISRSLDWLWKPEASKMAAFFSEFHAFSSQELLGLCFFSLLLVIENVYVILDLFIYFLPWFISLFAIDFVRIWWFISLWIMGFPLCEEYARQCWIYKYLVMISYDVL